MPSILRYAARVKAQRKLPGGGKNSSREKLAVALVGAGKLAGFLAPALAKAGYRITEIVARRQTASMKRARALARRVGARAVTLNRAALDAEVVWFAVPDSQIRRAAESLARHARTSSGMMSAVQVSAARSSTGGVGLSASGMRFAFHSSGALESGELKTLRKFGFGVASVHPLMTFVADSRPSLANVPFAIEGDRAAVKAARAIVRKLGANSFVLAARRKAAYHAWATMTSPLLLAYLVTLEEAGRVAGLEKNNGRRMSLPIMQQTVENYARLGLAKSFSGPFIRGDVETVAKHLALLKVSPKVRAVYAALARMALDGLPVRNRVKLRQLLEA